LQFDGLDGKACTSRSGGTRWVRYIVRLTDEEREQLTESVNKGNVAAYRLKHATVLLKVDAEVPK